MKSFFKRPARVQQSRLLAFDFLGITINLLLCFWIFMPIGLKPEGYSEYEHNASVYTKIWSIFEVNYDFALLTILFCSIYIAVFYIGGLYDIELIFDRKRAFIKLGTATFFGALLIYIFLAIFSKNIYPKYVWPFHLCSLFFVLLITKIVLLKKIKIIAPFKIFIVGKEQIALEAAERISQGNEKRFFSVSFCDEEEYLNKEISLEQGNEYDMIVYPYSKKPSEARLLSLAKAKFDRPNVCSSLDLYKFINGSFPVTYLDTSFVMSLSNSNLPEIRAKKGIKRFIDIAVSLLFIVIALPLMLIISVLIKLTSKGPVLFVHERLGLHQKPFRLYKFRTMKDNAEEKTGPVWAQNNDPRVTPIGRVLRRTWLDELPQLFNVLKGDMSLIGPRPIRKVFEDRFSKTIPSYFMRHLVKPGMTGWAQVNNFDARAADGPLRRFEYDLFYIHEYSLSFDALICLKTIQKVFRAGGQ